MNPFDWLLLGLLVYAVVFLGYAVLVEAADTPARKPHPHTGELS